MTVPWEERFERIFQDIPEQGDLEGAFAVLVGGLERAGSTMDLARAYKHAADFLSEELHKTGELWLAANPILFLYRHAAELALKAPLSGSLHTHNLGKIVMQLDRQLRDDFGEGFPGRLRKRLQEFSTFDKASHAFRYRDVLRGQSLATSALGEEVFVPLRNISLVVGAVLEFCATVCDMTRELRQWEADYGRE